MGEKKKKQASKKRQATAKQEWLTEEQKLYIHDTDEVRKYLSRWETFTPNCWTEEEAVSWVATTVPMSWTNFILTTEGYQLAEQLYSDEREYTEEAWALLRPGWWEDIESKHDASNVTLADFWATTPPDISGITVPALTEHWWRTYIQFKAGEQESDPRTRCAYLVAAGLLPNPFTEDDLIRFAESQIENPNPDTRYAEWDLTEKGFERLDNLANGETPPGGGDADTSTAKERDKGRAKRKPKSAVKKNIAAKLDVNAWEAITLEIDGNLVRVNGGKRGRGVDLEYNDLGIGRGENKDMTNRLARLLIMIAAAAQDKPYKPADDEFYLGAKGLDNFNTHMSRLNKALRESFGLKDNPVHLNEAGAVETCFKITAAGEDMITDKDGKPLMTGSTPAGRVAREMAAGQRFRAEYGSLAEAESAREQIEAKHKEKYPH